MAREAGILITQDEIRASGLIPKPIYTARTLPAIVANPEVMTWWSSASVRYGMNGLINMADSPCPTNGEAAATTASAPDTFMV